MFLCTCNNCGNVYEDDQFVSSDSINYPDNSQTLLWAPTLGENGCHDCGCNATILPNLIPAAGGQAKKIYGRIELLLKK